MTYFKEYPAIADLGGWIPCCHLRGNCKIVWDSGGMGTASTLAGLRGALPADGIAHPARIGGTVQNAFLGIGENRADRPCELSALFPPFDPVAKFAKRITDFRSDASLDVESPRNERVRFE